MLILGIADEGETSACALIRDGILVATAAHADFQALESTHGPINSVIYFEKPLLKFERVVETFLNTAPQALKSFKAAIPEAFRNAFFKKKLLRKAWNIPPQKILFSDYQTSLAAQSFFASPYEEVVILSLSGGGEWASSSVALGNGSSMQFQKTLLYPHSLDAFKAAFAGYLGCKPEDFDALAAQGNPTYARMMARTMIDVKEDGSFLLHQDYFGSPHETTELLHNLMGGPAGEQPFTQRHANIAASVQAIMEHVAARMVHALAREYRGVHALCLAGDIACSGPVMGRILREAAFRDVHVPALRGNEALAHGAALAAHYLHHGHPRDVLFLQQPDSATRS